MTEAGYRYYVDAASEERVAMLAEVRLTEKHQKKSTLCHHDNYFVMHQVMKTILCMVPFDRFQFPSMEALMQNANILQPLECLGGQNICDFMLSSPDDISKRLQ